ncbi:MAG: hypothetical protein K0Q72_5239 [Armatimonadetes bacterium]|jgi:hypothetical protein|nr:hypothetical protein [Armatimonadota bacterium]
MGSADYIGSRGEYLAYVLLTRFHGRDRPFFRPYFLGEKAEKLDFLVELVDAGERVPFFFVQVRSTRRGYTGVDGGTRQLRVRVTADELRALAARPVPTYLIGISESDEEGYLLSARQPAAGGLSSLPIDFRLDGDTLGGLWAEVRDFWDQFAPATRPSVFIS